MSTPRESGYVLAMNVDRHSMRQRPAASQRDWRGVEGSNEIKRNTVHLIVEYRAHTTVPVAVPVMM